jgi:hypothetical protein
MHAMEKQATLDSNRVGEPVNLKRVALERNRQWDFCQHEMHRPILQTQGKGARLLGSAPNNVISSA